MGTTKFVLTYQIYVLLSINNYVADFFARGTFLIYLFFLITLYVIIFSRIAFLKF